MVKLGLRWSVRAAGTSLILGAAPPAPKKKALMRKSAAKKQPDE